MAQKFKTSISVEELAAASSQAVGVKVDGDSEARVKIDAGGKITWGSGDAAGDVTLYRSAANALKTDDLLEAAAGVITLTTSGTPTASLANGAIAVDTTNHIFYYRSNDTWNQVSSGASITVQDTPPASPDPGDMWFESDTGNTLVYYEDANTSQWVEIGASGDPSQAYINMDGGIPSSNYTGINSIDAGSV